MPSKLVKQLEARDKKEQRSGRPNKKVSVKREQYRTIYKGPLRIAEVQKSSGGWTVLMGTRYSGHEGQQDYRTRSEAEARAKRFLGGSIVEREWTVTDLSGEKDAIPGEVRYDGPSGEYGHLMPSWPIPDWLPPKPTAEIRRIRRKHRA